MQHQVHLPATAVRVIGIAWDNVDKVDAGKAELGVRSRVVSPTWGCARGSIHLRVGRGVGSPERMRTSPVPSACRKYSSFETRLTETAGRR